MKGSTHFNFPFYVYKSQHFVQSQKSFVEPHSFIICQPGSLLTMSTGRVKDNPKMSQTPVSKVKEDQSQQDDRNDHIDVLEGVLELPRRSIQGAKSDSYDECGNEDN